MMNRYAFIERNNGIYQEVSFDLDIANYTLEKKLEELLDSGDSWHIFYSGRSAEKFRNKYQVTEKICL